MLRLNVVCTERDQRFMVLAKEGETLDQLRHQTQKIFGELYPNEAPLDVTGFQNEFHFDIPLQYRIGEALIDTGLVFAIEGHAVHKTSVHDTDSGINISCQDTSPGQAAEWRTEKFSTILNSKKRKFENSKRKLKLLHKKRKSSFISPEVWDVPPMVSSTCSPKAGGSPLFPQRVESGDEDNEVDIESVHEETAKAQAVDKSPESQQQNGEIFLTSTPTQQTSLSPSKKSKKASKKKKKKSIIKTV